MALAFCFGPLMHGGHRQTKNGARLVASENL